MIGKHKEIEVTNTAYVLSKGKYFKTYSFNITVLYLLVCILVEV